MREHKYRVWNNGTMKYTPLISMGIFHMKNKDSVDFEVNGEIMQFCDFEDSNGKSFDWWEGDILHLDKEQFPDDDLHVIVIVKKDGCFMAQHYEDGKPYADDGYFVTVHVDHWIKKAYVKVGIIHENPELLK